MKTTLRTKLLQHFAKKKHNNEGFTLIELLVVIIIIGILAAIALPSFLNQASKARGAEAKSNVGAMNRAQQAYYVEQQKFTGTVPDLGLSLGTSNNFSYAATASGTTATNQGTSTQDDIKSYGGKVTYTASAASTPGSFSTILCEANDPGKPAVTPTSATDCGDSATQVK